MHAQSLEEPISTFIKFYAIFSLLSIQNGHVQELLLANLPVRNIFILEFLAYMEMENGHGTFCGQPKPISISNVLPIYKTAGYVTNSYMH